MGKVIAFNRPGVDLHGDLVTRRKINESLKSVAKLAELLTVEVGGSPSPEVNLAYMKRLVDFSTELLQIANLLQQMIEKELDFGTVVGNNDVADAVMTQLRTERDMNVYMQWLTSSEKFPE